MGEMCSSVSKGQTPGNFTACKDDFRPASLTTLRKVFPLNVSPLLQTLMQPLLILKEMLDSVQYSCHASLFNIQG